MFCIFFHVLNNTQVVQKVSDLDLTITSQPIGIPLKAILSNKDYFMLTLRMTNIMVRVIGQLLSLLGQKGVLMVIF